MSTKKTVVFMLLATVFGYSFHDLIQNKAIKPLFRVVNISNNQPTETVLGQESDSEFVTSVIFDGRVFRPDRITVKKGNYLVITNQSATQLMWLISDYKEVTTVRGFGEGERLQVALMQEGSYTISNKLVPKATIELLVE